MRQSSKECRKHFAIGRFGMKNPSFFLCGYLVLVGCLLQICGLLLHDPPLLLQLVQNGSLGSSEFSELTALCHQKLALWGHTGQLVLQVAKVAP